jgi:ATP-dependent DNA ligase
MLPLGTNWLPEGPNWAYKLKLDGYHARYPSLREALELMPDDTVLDGAVVALDEKGRPSFSTLQNRGPGLPLHFFIFDLLILGGRDVMDQPLVKRRAFIEKHVLPTLRDPIRYSPILEASLPNLIRSVKEQGRRVGQDAGQSVAGVCDRRIHVRRPSL